MIERNNDATREGRRKESGAGAASKYPFGHAQGRREQILRRLSSKDSQMGSMELGSVHLYSLCWNSSKSLVYTSLRYMNTLCLTISVVLWPTIKWNNLFVQNMNRKGLVLFTAWYMLNGFVYPRIDVNDLPKPGQPSTKKKASNAALTSVCKLLAFSS
ncbi:hypothetical protein COOONC_04545 [Cooperia oncophora]